MESEINCRVAGLMLHCSESTPGREAPSVLLSHKIREHHYGRDINFTGRWPASLKFVQATTVYGYVRSLGSGA